MRNSLKTELLDAIKRSYPNLYLMQEMEDLAVRKRYKVSNCERRARELVEVSLIEPIKNEKGYLTGYILIPRQDPPLYKNPQPQML